MTVVGRLLDSIRNWLSGGLSDKGEELESALRDRKVLAERLALSSKRLTKDYRC